MFSKQVVLENPMPIPQEFLTDYKKVQSGELAYMVYSYDKNFYLTLGDKEENFDEDEFVECFNTSKASHAVLGVQLNDLRKTILINWLGDSAPPQLKGRYAGLVSEVDALITCHVVHNARSESDINYKLLESLVMKAGGTKYNLANSSTVSKPQAGSKPNVIATQPPLKPSIPTREPATTSNKPNIPTREPAKPSIPQRSPEAPPRTFDYSPNTKAVPSIPQRQTTQSPTTPQKSSPVVPQRPARSTTAQMIADQRNDESDRNRSPSPPKRTVPDHRKEIQELRNISLTAAANWEPEKDTRLSESDLRKIELQQLRQNPATTATDYEVEPEVKKLSDPELRRQEFESITSTAALKAKFQQLETSSSNEDIRKSPGSSLNDLRNKFEHSSLDSLSQKKQEPTKTPVSFKQEPSYKQEPVKQFQLPTLTSSPSAASHDAVALYDYAADESNELSFKAGDLIYSITKVDTAWWQGTSNGQTGLFPGNFVEEVANNKQSTPPVQPARQNVPEPVVEPVRALPAQPIRQTSQISATALYDYDAQESNELSFKVGNVITAIIKIDEGWWEGSLNSHVGLFPRAFGIL